MNLVFLVVPELANEVTLGLDFFMNRHFHCMTSEKVYLNLQIPQHFPLKNKSRKDLDLMELPIAYVATKVNLISSVNVKREPFPSQPKLNHSNIFLINMILKNQSKNLY